MSICSSCGSNSINTSFCPNCGMKMPSDTGGTPENNVTEEKAEKNAFIPAGGHVCEGDLSGESPAQLPPDVERIKREYVALPDSSGQTIFTVVNIILGILFFCVGGIISLIFTIIAAYHISKADKAQSREDAEDALGVANMMNIVAVIALLLCFAACVILFVMRVTLS